MISPHSGRLRIALLGATGSIGTSTVAVCREHADKIELVALGANTSVAQTLALAQEFGVKHVAFADHTAQHDVALEQKPAGCEVSFGAQAIADLATLDEVDLVVNAVVGFAGIRAGYQALLHNKLLAYANKESIVVGGQLLMPLVQPGQLRPVDSEHSAIWQCLVGEDPRSVRYLWLTCSGGPFRGYTRQQLAQVSCEQALAHPTWSMGSKITIDSATLMNKGLEVIEAHYLFSVPLADIKVLVHPQSKIHSGVEFIDGSTKAQLGASDMRVPIQYALSYPDRWASAEHHVDWCASNDFSFAKADEKSFGLLALARMAGEQKGTAPCILNAANEVANLAFRQHACGFLDIERCVEGVLSSATIDPVESIEQLEAVDAEARRRATQLLKELAHA